MDMVVKPQDQASRPEFAVEDGLNANLAPRAYQLEMVAESMRRNIIAAAVLRIQAELQRCPPDKMVWFCVPTVALAYQQYKVILTQLPAYEACVLSGKDNCDHWKEKTWLDVLDGMRIVISTPKILLDALVHAFVEIGQLGLLIFDEAHGAMGEHPSKLIMRDWYHQASETQRPHVLGLTASPLRNSKVEDLNKLESNLNAISRAPKFYREELLKFVHLPDLVAHRYLKFDIALGLSTALRTLSILYKDYDMDSDPWIIRQRSIINPNERDHKYLAKALIARKTWCIDQLHSLVNRTQAVLSELGFWAAEFYVHTCVEKFRHSVSRSSNLEEPIEDIEKKHLLHLLDQIQFYPGLREASLVDTPAISPKVQCLANVLKRQNLSDFAGLIFVRTRAEVAILPEVLTRLCLMQPFSISTFVGESSSSNRPFSLSELADLKNQKDTLDDLRSGKTNLVITTNALEEGIDVSACNFVICFEKPPNLKSFVQRRGRARKEVSTYIIMFEDKDRHVLSKWQELEEQMRRLYEDEMRELEILQKLEDEDCVEYPAFRVESTGAKLSLSDAVSHLYHFCNTLSAGLYVDRVPIFHFDSASNDKKNPMISAKVILPCSVDVSIREAKSILIHRSEKNAKRDAAFQAYVALYHAGLINEHLIPVGTVNAEVEEAYALVEKRPNLVEVHEQFGVWSHIATQWEGATTIYRTLVTIRGKDSIIAQMLLLSPISLPQIGTFPLFWDSQATFKVSMEVYDVRDSVQLIEEARQDTATVFKSVFPGRIDDRLDFTTPVSIVGQQLSHGSVEYVSRDDLSKLAVLENFMDIGLVHDSKHVGLAYTFQGLEIASAERTVAMKLASDNDELDQEQPIFKVRRFPKRIDLLHRISTSNRDIEKGDGRRYLLPKDCRFDRFPMRYSITALCLPSILHVIQKSFIVERLCSSILTPLDIKDQRLYSIAVTASSARDHENYQRLEFLGDSILKYSTSIMLAAGNLKYHEGILSHLKDHIVSNGSLSIAATKAGLDRFIITKPFSGKKWRPPYNSEFSSLVEEGRTREMSTKTLADVVESLIGAAYLDGGLPKAIACLEIFLPDKPWPVVSEAKNILFEAYPAECPPHPKAATLQALIGHSFARSSLLQEALTHPAYRSPSFSLESTGLASLSSYQRLEYLGDAILDNIVTIAAYSYSPPISVERLHLIRTALVNGDFLGYLCLSHSTPESVSKVNATYINNISTSRVIKPFALWQAMRHSSSAVAAAQQSCLIRLELLEGKLSEHFQVSDQLVEPSSKTGKIGCTWTALATLAPPKFFSDIIESLIGALWIDSHGSLDVCKSFLDLLGWTRYLDFVLEKGGEGLLHPKEEVGRLADQDKVTYQVFVTGDDEDSNENVADATKAEGSGGRRLSCKLLIGEEVVVEIRGGMSRMEIETRAAEGACEILRARGPSSSTRTSDRRKKDDSGLDQAVGHDNENETGKGQEQAHELDEGGNSDTDDNDDKSEEDTDDDDDDEEEKIDDSNTTHGGVPIPTQQQQPNNQVTEQENLRESDNNRKRSRSRSSSLHENGNRPSKISINGLLYDGDGDFDMHQNNVGDSNDDDGIGDDDDSDDESDQMGYVTAEEEDEKS